MARGVKNVKLEALLDSEGGGKKEDVGKMIAEQQRKAQNHRMN